MYTRNEASAIRKKFWTSFGQYMRPISGASGETINWLNYKTGIRHLYFRMDADNKRATIAIELRQPDTELRRQYYNQLLQFKPVLEENTGEQWTWQPDTIDEDGAILSRIGTVLENVNVMKESDWPAIIAFLKPRIIALDEFWEMIKDSF
jgi:hypothetical protein